MAIRPFLPYPGKNHIYSPYLFFAEYWFHMNMVSRQPLWVIAEPPVSKTRGGVRTGSHTKTAPDTTITVNQNNSILPFECGIYRTNLYTGRFIAMHAGGRLPVRCSMFSILHDIYLDPVFTGIQFVRMIAGSLTGFYTFASGKINHHNKFLSSDPDTRFGIDTGGRSDTGRKKASSISMTSPSTESNLTVFPEGVIMPFACAVSNGFSFPEQPVSAALASKPAAKNPV